MPTGRLDRRLSATSLATKLHDQCPQPRQDNSRHLLPDQVLPQENPRQDGDLAKHGAVDDAGLQRRACAQHVIPNDESESHVHHG